MTLLRSATDERLAIGHRKVCRATAQKNSISELKLPAIAARFRCIAGTESAAANDRKGSDPIADDIGLIGGFLPKEQSLSVPTHSRTFSPFSVACA